MWKARIIVGFCKANLFRFPCNGVPMTDEQSLRDIESLLNLYPSVTAAKVMGRDDNAVYIQFQCDCFQSLRKLCHHATFTNVGIEVEPVMTPHDPLHFSITIPNDNRSDSPPSQTQRFGVFLAWDLKNRGILSPCDANDLLRRWNASSEPRTLSNE